MHALVLLLLLLWPFAPARPGHHHSRAYHAKRLAHLQEARATRLAKSHGAAHPSLIHR